jgi:asparagine synthase (glutamine-hydrolysing)
VPVGEWLDERFLARLERCLSGHPALAPWFCPEGVRQLIARTRNTRQGSAMLWALLQFAVWHRLFLEGDGARPPTLLDPLELLA